MSRFRERLKKKRLYKLLQETIKSGFETKVIKNKLYSFHEPQTVCISKGKANKRYEFGNKSTFITTAKECFILHADAHEKNPYDGHTLQQALDSDNNTAKEILNSAINYLFADKGYKGHQYTGKTTVLLETAANKKRHKQLKRRASIEAVFSHTKQYHRMGRNFLKGSAGDLINTILSACGYNLKKIYNKFKRAYKKMLSLLFFMLFGDYLCLGRISVLVR